MDFEKLNIITPILKAICEEGYTTPTLIQQQAIPVILEGRDLLGCAQTGTGKTAAFAIPLLQTLYKERTNLKGQRIVKGLILTPTRELAIQIGESLEAYGRYTGIKHAVIFGGVSQVPQVNKLRSGVDIIVATPGRLLDLMNQKYINVSCLKMLILDEADRMLDMGFSFDVKKIISRLTDTRQTLLFSATMPKEITKMVDAILKNPVKVEVTPVSSTVDTIEQNVYFVEQKDKKSLLIKLLKNRAIESVLVFTRTKHGADKIAKDLAKLSITAQAIHGDKSQVARQIALNNFKLKRTRVLVATDIAARGIDIQELSHIINFDLPNVPETYVHRIGRTGRAGMVGTALSFCDREEMGYLRAIQKLISKKIPVVEEQPYSMRFA
ncbi:DEAD/DEAH box helicase [Acetivibrio cellulolyticus]|uniref:DEAD/DEAH box helicase n=1 Tax=Acetivibrio cellulolyticus TaxID=35830 RepID=UPI0001E2D8B2|nr:DEAD/DEAH box helicase [Acetivibrio cellulolyticus]